MHRSFTLLNTDQINKYGYVFPLTTLEDMMWQKGTEGVPMHVGHDMHRPIGAIIPFALYFEPYLVRSLGITLLPETDTEWNQIKNFKRNSVVKNLSHYIEKNEGRLLNLVKDKLSQDFKYHIAGTLAIVDDNIVNSLFPELQKLLDKDGLIDIRDLNGSFEYKYHGAFVHKEVPLCIYAHSYFRRSLSRYNNFHSLFLDELMTLQENKRTTLKIALDWDMVGYAPDFTHSMEFEYWFGPKYTDDISQIKLGLTRYNTTGFDREYYDISSTEFYWKNNENLREFELEELRENNVPTLQDFFGCRYIHSIFDTNINSFIHFDGAIRGYSSDLFFERLSNKLTEFGRNSQYKKLFRIDGSLDLKDWKTLITKYMQGNPLIYEYFGIDKPKSQLDHDEVQKTLIQRLVPHEMSEEDGIRLLVSYHERNDDFKGHSHAVSIYDVLSIDDEDCSIVEYDLIEVKKALQRLGKDLFIKEDVLFGSIKDEYWNIPCIHHSDKEPERDIELTLKSLKMILGKMVEKGLGCIISWTISWTMEDKEVRVSSLGHIRNLYTWMGTFKGIPTDRQNFVKWLEDQKRYLNSNFKPSYEKPLVKDICQFDGVLYMKRVIVGEEFALEPYLKEGNLAYTIKVPDNDSKYKEILDGSIKAIPAYVVKKSTCSRSRENYLTSPFSKWLDSDVHTIIEEIEGLTFYWTDKPVK